MNVWWTRFQRNFGFWSLQCVISALPGFCIAMWFLKLHENPFAPHAMLAALATFILGVTALFSLSGNLTKWRTLPSRGLRLGLILRGISSGVSLIVIAVIMANSGNYENPVTLLMLDVWTGAAAVLPLALLSEPLGFVSPADQIINQQTNLSFLMIYAIAIIDGLILCFLIFIGSFVAMLILQIRDRKAMYGSRSKVVPAFLAKLRAMGPGNAIRVSGKGALARIVVHSSKRHRRIRSLRRGGDP